MLIAAGFVSPAFAQTVIITVDNETDSRSLSLDSFVFDGQTLSVQASSSGTTTPPPTTDPVQINRTLTVTAPTNGTIVNNATNQPVSGSIPFSYMSDDPAPTISLKLVPNSGYQAASWGGACTGTNVSNNCTLSMSVNRTVSASFQTQAPVGSCGAVPAGTELLQTSPPGTTFLGTVANGATTASTIHAYQFNSGGTNNTGRTVATRATGGEGKLVVITECPGQINQPVAGAKCSAYSSESSTVWYSTNPSANQRTYCVLDPNKTYYANVVNQASFLGGAPTCTTKCGFYFQKD
tara:strand:+ start:2540 stop:3421 length:882 start_codon:yes stop_codon:yes gene_type:complete